MKPIDKLEITDEAAAQLLREHQGDIEVRHLDADELLCRLLEARYPLTVKAFRELPKWYA